MAESVSTWSMRTPKTDSVGRVAKDVQYCNSARQLQEEEQIINFALICKPQTQYKCTHAFESKDHRYTKFKYHYKHRFMKFNVPIIIQLRYKINKFPGLDHKLRKLKSEADMINECSQT